MCILPKPPHVVNCSNLVMKKLDGDDLDDVLRQEIGRSKRYVPSQQERLDQRNLKRQWRDILKTMKWADVVSALSLQQGTQAYEEFRQLWKSYRRDSGGS